MATGFAYIPATSDGCTVLAVDTAPCGCPGSTDKGCDVCAEEYNEMPDGYGGFGASHCACGELVFNCDGKCQYVAETAPEVEPSFEDYLARRMEPRDPATVAWLEDFPF